MNDASAQTCLISDAAEVRELCARLARCARVALDTEADSFHSYHHKLCLIQLSFDGTNALLDPLALGRGGLAPLVDILADPAVLKLMHGADYDLRVLDRDLAARVRGVRDTQVAAQLLGETTTGLAALSLRELGIELDKSLQRMDWSVRPLPTEALAYAAADTAGLADLADRLEARLAALGRHEWWYEECRVMEEIRWSPPEPDPCAFERVKGARGLRGAARDRLAALHAWREALAASLDVPTFRIMRNELLVALAASGATSLDELGALKGMPASTVRRHGRQILGAIAHPPPAPTPARSPRARPDRLLEQRVRDLREVRDQVATTLGLAPGVLAPRGVLEAVAGSRPSRPEDLAQCLGRAWRCEVLGSAFATVVAAWDDRQGEEHAASV